MIHYQWLTTPCGELLIAINEQGLVRVEFADGLHSSLDMQTWRKDNQALAPYRQQFEAYFAGQLKQFDLPMAASGTPFQQSVWRALSNIPYGQTCCYSDIARAIANPKAVRAVGAANGRNPLSIIVPCHRVIGANGRLTGYAGGLAAKQALLQLEQRWR